MESLLINRLLVPIDFRAASLNALDLAIAMGLRHEAEIRLLHVINPGEYLLTWDDATFSSEAVVESELAKLKQLAEVRSTTHGVHISFECRLGKICDSIAEAAHEFKATCIVMGTHGISGFREYFVGSEAYRVVKAAICPVLTVPPHRKWTQFNKIIFPIRPVSGVLEKYGLARSIILKNKAHLTVLGFLDRHNSALADWIRQQVVRLVNQLAEDEIKSNTLLLATDSIAKAVLQKAEESNADLLIITADQDAASQHFIVGSFVQQLVNHAKMPVLSIRPSPHLQS